MTLSEAKEIVFEREKERIKYNNRIFYPDPCEENNCAQCGKPKEAHELSIDKKPFFCNRLKKKDYDELMDEAAEVYAEWRAKNGFIIGAIKKEDIESTAEQYILSFDFSNDTSLNEKGREKVKGWGKRDFIAGAIWVAEQLKSAKSEQQQGVKVIPKSCTHPIGVRLPVDEKRFKCLICEETIEY